LHVFEEDLQLLCLPPSLLHASLDDDCHLVFWVEFAWVRQVTCVKRHLDVLDIVNVLLRVLDQLFDIDLLRSDHTADFVGETFPARVLVAHDTFDEVGKRRFVLVVLEHAKSR
jgi:hypothetical protein